MSGPRGVVAAQEAQWVAHIRRTLKEAITETLTERPRPEKPSMRVVEHLQHMLSTSDGTARQAAAGLEAEVRKLKAENQRLTEAVDRSEAQLTAAEEKDAKAKAQQKAIAATDVKVAVRKALAAAKEQTAADFWTAEDALDEAVGVIQAAAKAAAKAEAAEQETAAERANQQLKAENQRLSAEIQRMKLEHDVAAEQPRLAKEVPAENKSAKSQAVAAEQVAAEMVAVATVALMEATAAQTASTRCDPPT